MKPFILRADLSMENSISLCEGVPRRILARVAVLDVVVKRSNCFNNIFTCDLREKVGPGSDA